MKPLTSVGNLTMRAAVAPFMKRFSLRLNLALLLAIFIPLMAYAQGPTPGQNVNMVSGTTWLAARRALLAKEKEFTKLRDDLSRQRRELPWVKVEKDYVFEGPNGKERRVGRRTR